MNGNNSTEIQYHQNYTAFNNPRSQFKGKRLTLYPSVLKLQFNFANCSIHSLAIDAFLHGFLPAVFRILLFFNPTNRNKRPRSSGRDVPEAKNQGKIISRRPTRSRVTDASYAVPSWRDGDCCPHLSENLFPLASAFFGAMMNKSACPPSSPPPPNTYASKTRATCAQRRHY